MAAIKMQSRWPSEAFTAAVVLALQRVTSEWLWGPTEAAAWAAPSSKPRRPIAGNRIRTAHDQPSARRLARWPLRSTAHGAARTLAAIKPSTPLARSAATSSTEAQIVAPALSINRDPQARFHSVAFLARSDAPHATSLALVNP
ncbi:hypothetical protein EJ02DRAFT_427664 [Clathrospora elynae]|uniref:Uncharacterized protein n=1 Tax=Clathrospora elynae TaxID=706981 RepID=A0A6A5S6P2_9PLEO|nr:hypothetical protein EJ02DRAFT_427664 [Clathrospora elynae]